MTKVNRLTGRAHAPVKQKSYPNATWFTWELRPFKDIYDLADTLDELADCKHKFVIRGHPIDADTEGKRVRKSKHPHEKGDPPYFKAARRAWLMVDIDKIAMPDGYDVRVNPKACVRHVLDLLANFAPEVTGVTAYAQLSSSAGLDEELRGAGADPRLSVHLWFVLATPASDAELKRWADRINARYGALYGGKLIDVVPFRTVQPNYTADPIFEGVADPLKWRGRLFDGEHDELALDIPDEAEIAALPASGSSNLPSGLECAEYLDMIGHDKGGFQDPILQACIAAVNEQGDALDRAAFIAEVSARVRQAPPGARSKSQIAHYASKHFIGEKIDWAQNIFATKQQRAEARAIRRKERSQDDTEAELFAPQKVREAEIALHRALSVAVADGQDYRAMRARYRALKDAAYAEIDADGCVADDLPRRDKLRALERRRLKAELAKEFDFDHFADHAPAKLIRCTTGLGKTQRMLEMLAEWRGGRVELYAPTHELLAEIYSKLMAMRAERPRCRKDSRGALVIDGYESDVHLMRGRSQPDPESRLIGKAGKWKRGEDRMCARYAEAAAVSDVELSVQSTLCSTCPLAKSCGYQAQFDGIVPGSGIVLMPHAYLLRNRPEQLGGPVELAVIDESPTGQCYIPHTFDKTMLSDAKRIAEMAKDRSFEGAYLASAHRLATALANQGFGPKPSWQPQAKERQEVIGGAAKALLGVMQGRSDMARLDQDALKQALLMLVKGRKDIELPGMSAAAFERTMNALRDARLLMRLIGQALDCIKRGFDIRETMEIGKRAVVMQAFVPPVVASDTPIIVLDATADARHLTSVFDRDFEETNITVPENIRLTQVIDVTGSKASITGRNSLQSYEDAPDGAKARQDKRIAQLVGVVRGFADGAEMLVVGHKEIVAAMRDQLPGNIESAHFGALRGLNAFEGLPKIVIIGRQTASCRQLEQQRAALFVRRGDRYSGGIAPWTVEEYAAKKRYDADTLPAHGYLEDDFGNPWHPDPITDALRRDTCENEIIQAVGRVRSIRQPEPVEVLLITSLFMEELPEPEREVKWLQLIRHGRVGNAFVNYVDGCAAQQTGLPVIAVPCGARDMHMLSPQNFRTENAAKMAQQKFDARGEKIEIRVPEGSVYAPVERASYRVDGQRGSASPAFIRAKHGLNNVVHGAEKTLSRLLGGVVRVFLVGGR